MRTRLLSSVVVFALILVASTALAQDKPADVTGTWKWTAAGRGGGGTPQEWTLKLKQEGDKVTGTVTRGTDPETAITDGTIKNGEVAFTVSRTRNDQTFVTKYTGKLEGDTIKGKSERDRNGEKVATDWEAKRVKTPA